MTKTYNEEDIITLMEMLARIYYHLAEELLGFGEEGELALRRAIRAYARDRGLRLRKIHQEKGYPLNVRSLYDYYDLPGTETSRFRRKQLEFDDVTQESETYECQFCQIWNEIGGEKALRTLGQIYCNEFHPEMWGTYNPEISVKMPRLLTQGDPYCKFEVHQIIEDKGDLK